MRVSSRGSVESRCPRRRPRSRYRHCSPRKVSQRPPGPSRLVRGEALTKVRSSFRKSPARSNLFPSAQRGAFSLRTVYGLFRKLLLECGIAHAGRGTGPRIHDLRHTFAVHTLLRWYRDGEDLDAKLPLLATYLGHQHLSGTQRYLHLTAELFPEITARLDAVFGEVIPRRIEP